MGLTVEQRVLLRDSLKIELDCLKGDTQLIKNTLKCFVSESGQDAFLINKQAFDQTETIRKFLAEPFQVIGHPVTNISGELTSRRALSEVDHCEAIQLIQQEILSFINTTPCLPELEKKESEEYLPHPCPTPSFDDHNHSPSRIVLWLLAMVEEQSDDSTNLSLQISH